MADKPEAKDKTEPKEEVKKEIEKVDTPAQTEELPQGPHQVTKDFFDGFTEGQGNKKLRLAIFIVFALLLALGGYLLKPTIEHYLNPEQNFENYLPVSSEPTSMHLEINNPDDELLTFDKAINISGKASPKSSIIISNGDLNWGTDADEQGEFSKVIDLKSGINLILIYAFDPQGNNKTESRQIYMSEEKI